MVLKKAGIWNVVSGKEPKPCTDPEKWEKNTEEGLTLIGLKVDQSKYSHIGNARKGVTAWKDLAAASTVRIIKTSVMHKLKFWYIP